MIGSLLLIVRRSLRQHALSTSITILSAALASGLVMAVFNISTQTTRAFAGGPLGFQAVLGARGSQLQLVMNSVFHLETSPGNIPWSLYEEVKAHPGVVAAIPYAVGDNYRGFRIVGTTDEVFTTFQYIEGRDFELEPGGRVYDTKRREAIIGSIAAKELGLGLGDTFQPYHNITFDSQSKQHEEEYLIVGVMKPTNSPSDRVLWIPIDGVYRMKGHELWGTGEKYVPKAGTEIDDEHKEVSAVLLKLKSGQVGFSLQFLINRQGKVATLAWPIATVMLDLFNKLGWVNDILELVAYLVVVVAAGSLLASLYNTMNERRREFAILRALGARKGTVFSVIVLESTTIAFLGSLLGVAVYFGIFAATAEIVRARTGVVLDLGAYHAAIHWTPIAMVGIGAVAGLLPAIKAYSTDVADTLAHTA